MSDSYPRRNQARGLWKINDITKNIKEDGTYPSGATRGVISGGNTPSTVNTVDFITIETTGNAADFGDLTVSKTYAAVGQTSSFTRGVSAGGYNPSYLTAIDYFQIMTTGNSIDFGDAVTSGRGGAACSNGHGGLG